jgi:P-type E1-E2 ATPase
MKKMQQMTAFENKVKVLRDGRISTISSKDLLPGDVFEVRSQITLPCDALLLSGHCLVNEMMLTGESVFIYLFILMLMMIFRFQLLRRPFHMLLQMVKFRNIKPTL